MRQFAQVCLAAGFASLISAWAKAEPPSAAQLQAWVKQLDAEDYAVREEATRKLIEASEASIEALAQGILSSSPEVAWRASESLQQIAVEGDERALSRVVEALDNLSHSGKPGLTNVAQHLRDRQARLRHDRASAQIRSLGGKLAGNQIAGVSFDGAMVGGFFGGFDVLPAVAGDLGGDLPPEFIEEVDILRAPEAIAPEAPPEKPLVLKALDAALERLSDLLPAKAEAEPPMIADAAGPPSLIAPEPEPAAPPAPAAPQVPADEAAPAEEPAPPAAEAPLLDPPAEGEVEVALGEGEVVIADAIALDAMIAGPIFGGGFFVEEGVLPAGEDVTSTSLALDADWRGGDEGLKALGDLPSLYDVSIENARLTDAALEHLAKLPNLRQLSIHATKFSGAALRKFRERRPESRVIARGDAMLGIHADVEGSCVLTSIYHGSGAFEAGLQGGDEIVAIDGQKVRDFSDLTIAVYTHDPGDKLKVEYLRAGRPHAVDVTLKSRSVVEKRNE
jgi:hypothetical protein